MKHHHHTKEAMDLLRDGSIALAEVERAGVRVDKGYLDQAIANMQMSIVVLERQLAEDREVYPIWKTHYGDLTNLGSRTQIAKVVFGLMKYESPGTTAKGGRHRADKAALESVDLPFVKNFLKIEETKKALSTYLLGIRREMVERDGMYFVHPSYNLNTVVSYRSSCSNPNFQNIPVRNPEIGEIIRRCYIPRPGRHFVEIDFSTIEVRSACWYNNDPVLINYVTDKTSDMHRDQACLIFCLKPDQVTKETRHTAKNMWVFPQFYGSVYFQCAQNIWEAIGRRKLTAGKDGLSLYDHLKSKGITELGNCDAEYLKQYGPWEGTFAAHLKEVERQFWDRFSVYAQWKRDWYDAYLRDGGFTMLSGFALNGLFSRNEVGNLAGQGTAFHCELKCLIEVLRRLKMYRMKSLVVGEIHDSDQGDVPPGELDDYLNISQEVKTEWLPKQWKFINTPVEVEMEVAPLRKSWHEKQAWVKTADVWGPKPR